MSRILTSLTSLRWSASSVGMPMHHSSRQTSGLSDVCSVALCGRGLPVSVDVGLVSDPAGLRGRAPVSYVVCRFIVILFCECGRLRVRA
ncbi:hypothetical protein THIOKS1570027 [Thiocapsa sp. KS1]|nr:hypothetical protein THIOKS1570027 [Thiocapsa sp. KS1]